MRTTARRFGMLLSATALSLALAAPTASAEPAETAGGDYPCWHHHHHHGGLFLGLNLSLNLGLGGHHHHFWDGDHWCGWPAN